MSSFFEIKRARDKLFYFNLKSSNGEVILTSEAYKQKASALNGICSVQKNSADESRYSCLKNKNGKIYFTLKAANYQVIGTSEIYETEESRKKGIESVKRNGSTILIKDLTKKSTD